MAIFKSAQESLQQQLDNDKQSVVKLKGVITEPLVVNRSVTFTGKVKLQAPLVINSGLVVTFDHADISITGWEGQIIVMDSYTGHLALKDTTIAYGTKLIQQYVTHANTGADIPVMFFSEGRHNTLSIRDSYVPTMLFSGDEMTVDQSEVGTLFGTVSGFYGGRIDVSNSSLSNFDLTGAVTLQKVTTQGDLFMYDLSAPATVTDLTAVAPAIDAKTQQLNKLQQQLLRVSRLMKRLTDGEVMPVTVLTVNGEAVITGVEISDDATQLLDTYHFGYRLLHVRQQSVVTISNYKSSRPLEFVSETEGDLKIIGRIAEEISQTGDGRVSELAIDGAEDASAPSDAMAELQAMIGLTEVKRQLKTMIASVTMRKRRHQPMGSLHMIFSGNAGTGKTTVARLIADALFENGVIASSKVVVATKKDLVAGYVGQTAEKTKAVVEQAYGGVLFIDEAYTLTSDSSSNGFEAEAIAELIAQMENHRDELIVIMAGYTDEMQRFVESNQGLNSRFKTWIEFPDYSAKELAKIVISQLRAQGVAVYKEDAKRIMTIMRQVVDQGMNDGNGRFARNFTDLLVENRDVRLFDGDSVDRLVTQDYQAAIASIQKRAKLGH